MIFLIVLFRNIFELLFMIYLRFVRIVRILRASMVG
nr:MAG TPA: hypothetical protein [Caudoviricetes sp.]